MKFLITIWTAAGIIKARAESENESRILTGLLASSMAVVRLQVHETDAAGLIVREILDVLTDDLNAV